ncbi:hypothetical protein SKAU_G00366080 [Synaphobranchus kaupii]|uniref:Uncharacterized protein n=1 Tax=Synaphobranchus kaupii TaxID=118154 RepID=A0A9Q1EF44_SYNKA|nr:hypothetical protein SKAU_G00366080 [Synaphobranchus kaupii]
MSFSRSTMSQQRRPWIGRRTKSFTVDYSQDRGLCISQSKKGPVLNYDESHPECSESDCEEDAELDWEAVIPHIAGKPLGLGRSQRSAAAGFSLDTLSAFSTAPPWLARTEARPFSLTGLRSDTSPLSSAELGLSLGHRKRESRAGKRRLAPIDQS